MAESHPFANAGLGMFGQDVGLARQMATPEVKTDKEGKPLNPIGMGLAALLKAFGGGTKTPDAMSSPQGSVPPKQYEPSSAFPEVTQQQYTSPYISGGGPNQIWGNKPMQNPMYGAAPPMATAPVDPMSGFRTQGIYTPAQSATSTEGTSDALKGVYHSLVDSLWGNK
jgi:hypothetical protein